MAGFPGIRAGHGKDGIDFAPDGEATGQTLRLDRPFGVAAVTSQPAEAA